MTEGSGGVRGTGVRCSREVVLLKGGERWKLKDDQGLRKGLSKDEGLEHI